MLKKTFKTLIKDQRGLSTMEYAVLFVIIVIGSIAMWSKLGEDLATQVGNGQEVFNDRLGKANTTGKGGE